VRVVVVGPLPLPYNGMTVVTETILSSSLRQDFEIVHADTSDHRTVSNVGRLDARNVVLALKAAANVTWVLVKRDVNLVYVPIAKNRLGFLRDAPFLLAARAMRRTFVVHFHARGFAEFRRSQPQWMRLLIKLCLNSEGCHAIVLGECLRDEFVGLISSERVHVVANGVMDHRVTIDTTPPSRPIVLHLSTLWSEKGVFEVLESAAMLRTRFPDIHYVLAGDWYSPTEARTARRYIVDHELESYVEIVGPVASGQKDRLLAVATLMVFPSHSEGHPLVVLEALSAGLPVIATRVGAIPEIIEDGSEGFLVEPGEVSVLTDRISQVIGDSALQREMSRRARDRYERDFTAARFAERLGAVWSSIGRPTHVTVEESTGSRLKATHS
jgi:glycosyltransferase involved in cell wall biosynthesis